jgi:MFS family permease
VGSALIGVPAIAVIPFVPVSLTLLLAVIAGLGFASAVPVSISVAQRLLPHRTSLASALMMGGAWTISASGSILSQWLHDTVGLKTSFVIFAILLAGAAGVSMLISSRLLHETALADAG